MYFNPFILKLYLYNSPLSPFFLCSGLGTTPPTKKEKKKKEKNWGVCMAWVCSFDVVLLCYCLLSTVVGCKMVQCIVRMFSLRNEPILILLEVILCTTEESCLILFAYCKKNLSQ
jgi:D-alanyl-lipoteichoic acid acyltransferase DltB (MBOAT superfamily)